eukprot:TCONS_00027721-protein
MTTLMMNMSIELKKYFLFFWWSTLCCCWLPFLSCIQALSQEGMTIEQDSYGVDLNTLKHYEIVYPIELESTQAYTKHYQISAFGQSYDIFIKQNDILDRREVNGTTQDNLNNNIYVEYIDRNNSYQGKYWKPNNCFYNGPSVNDESLYLVLDYCDGLEGMIEDQNTTLFIEPIKTQNDTTTSSTTTTSNPYRKHLVYRSSDVKHKSKLIVDRTEKEPAIDFRLHALSSRRRQRRSGYQSFLYVINRSNRKVQIYYYDLKDRLIPFILLLPNEGRGINTFEATKWVVKDDRSDQIFHLNGRSDYTSTVNSQDKRYELVITVPPGTVFNDATSETNEVGGADYYIEVMILADKSMVDYHKKTHIEKYLNTMNQIVAGIFKHKSLGSRIHYKVTKIVLLESNDIGFSVYKGNPSRTLRSACEYTTSLKHSDEKHPDHFDVAIAITRKQFGPSGYAQMYSMCSNRRSCAIVNDEGLTSSFIVAHEVAHLLGLDHDGEGDSSRCKDDQSRGSVMAPVIVSSYSRYHWSSCSREVLKVNIGYFSCLENNPNKQKEQVSNKLPGSSYTIDEQCRMSHQGSSKCTTFDFNPCHRLWCSSTERKCISRGPALSGTVCGKNKFCFKGECVEEEDNQTTKLTTKRIVHGQWSRWTSWSSCSQSCGVGLRFRSRDCDSPRPGPRGRDCSGQRKEMDICSTQPCRLMKSYQTILDEQCSSIRDERWIRYKDQDFETRLKAPRNNLNCTFEDGMCNWQKEAIRSDLEWNLQSGPTNSRQTGPSSDHTTGTKSGKYIYMEASSTYLSRKHEGDVARLVSRVVQVPRVCFTFYYHMYGRDMGSLRVNVRFKNGTEVNRWNITGNQGDRWQSARISVENPEDFQFIIEAVRGGHWSGDIAVDDFSIAVGSCPEVRDPNPCKVSCRSRSALSFTLNLNVHDGVNCNPDPRSNDICLKGICVPFGCDNQFGSTSKLDNCGVCGGNGSSCSLRKGTKRVQLKQSYEVLFKLKKGSTFIEFVEKSDQFLYYGIRKKSNNAIHLSTSQEDYFIIGDVTFHFYKVNGRQRISSKGPTKEDLEIMVFSYQRSRVKPVVIDYDYYEPKGFTYEYRVTSWEPCSMSCGIGKQKSLSRCVRTDDNRKVSDAFCEGVKKPTVNYRTCKMKPCPERYIWMPRQWRECDKSCGGGRQYRKIDCVRVQDSALVSHRYCKSGDKPEESKICNTNKCYRWKAREWSSCSVSCGKGVRIRLTTCMDGDLAVEPEKCREEDRPRDHEVCQLQECEKFRWRVMYESACSKSCGGGNKAIIVNCVKVRKPNVPVDNEFCTGPEPARLKRCNTQACPEYVWKFGEEGPCSATCGSGTRERSVICVDQATDVETNEKNCKEKKPDIVVPCNERLCMRYKVAYSAWQDCDVMCGLGVQKRNPYCITEDYKRVVDHSLCGKQAKVKEERVCQKSSCAKPADLQCSFTKKSTCKWENGQTDDFDWSIGKNTPSLNTGPNSDHTTTNGYFAFIEASRPRRSGDRATLVSPIVRAKNGCLTFWYHMRGSTVGHLRLYLSTSVASNVLFEQKGEKGRKWLLATIDVSPSSGTLSGYKFIFEGKVGRAAYGDIAIDDINFYDQSCKDLKVFHNPILENCRERSPLCKKKDIVERYCRESQQFQLLCCKTCVKFMKKNSYTLTHS